MRFPFPAALLALLLAPLGAHALPVVKTEHVEAQLVSDVKSAQPGKPVLVGLKLRMIPDWHTYWKNPGDAGVPAELELTVTPEGMAPHAR